MKLDVDMAKLLKLQQVAEQMTLSRRTCQRLVRAGTLPHFRLQGRIRVAEADVQRYIDARFIPARGN